MSITCSQGVVAAAVLATAATLSGAPPAQASPLAPLPLAPACDQFAFNGKYLADGYPPDIGRAAWQVSFTASGQSTANAPALVSFSDGGQVKGRVIGGRIEGHSINFQVKWNDKPDNVWDFYGTIDDRGFARGAENGPGSGSPWSSSTALACASAPAAPPQQPAPPTALQTPARSPKKTATVLSDVDVYNIAADDVPDANGVVGTKIGTLSAGRVVDIGEPCTLNGWCKVLSPELPGGVGFAFGHLHF